MDQDNRSDKKAKRLANHIKPLRSVKNSLGKTKFPEILQILLVKNEKEK